MRAVMDEFTHHCLELLSPLGAVRARRMFGGQGLYLEELFIAILQDEQLFLKADAENRARFEAAGCEPFRYQRQGEWAQLGFYRPPEEALDSPALMQPWARLALEAALRARAAKAGSRPKVGSKAGPKAGKLKPSPGRSRPAR